MVEKRPTMSGKRADMDGKCANLLERAEKQPECGREWIRKWPGKDQKMAGKGSRNGRDGIGMCFEKVKIRPYWVFYNENNVHT